MKETGTVGVIGSGLGGLAAACTLAARGCSVTVFERNAWVGGKAAVLEEGGFRFDMGPTILTMPGVLRRIFAEAGENLDDHLELIPLDPQWRSFFTDGSVLDLHADVAKMKAVLNQFTGAPDTGVAYEEFLGLAERLDRISQRYFFWRPIGGMRDMFEARNLASSAMLQDVLSMRIGSTVGGTIRKFIRDGRVSQMLDHFTQYVGSAPDSSPAVLCGIAHMQTNEGVWYPKGGIRGVAQALANLARRLGVKFRLGALIERIVVQEGRAVGVECDGETIPLSAVVSNSDAVRTHRELLSGEPAARQFERRRQYEPACSGVVLYLGLRRRYDHLLHHNFVFSQDPHDEFEHIYRLGEPAPDPTCYVCAPSSSDRSVAPEGGEALYVLVHTPYLRPGHDWNRMIETYRPVILRKLRETAGLEDLDSRVVVSRVLTPQDIHERYRVFNGAIYGLASHGRFFGAFKPGNRTAVAGLYLCGGAAHPGPGMPMVLMSGWIAGDTLSQDLGQGPRSNVSAAVPKLAAA